MPKTQAFTVRDGWVLSLTGEWWTPEQLLIKVKEQILAEPEHYNQDEWFKGTWSPVTGTSCNTVCCIGGWCELLTTGVVRPNTDDAISEFFIGSRHWPWLFGFCWPDSVYCDRLDKPTAQEAAVAIETFIVEMRPRWAEEGRGVEAEAKV